ncbi:MAG: CRTAC1 family protein [Planctomycetota bacterium]
MSRFGGSGFNARCVALCLSISILATGCGDETPPAPQDWFVDRLAGSGIDFRHVTGATGQKHLPETMGSGVALFDYDRDGDLDCYFVQGGNLPGLQGSPGVQTTNRLYRNEGGLRFVDVTEEAGVGDDGYGMGCVVGDIDGDGDLDLYVTNFGPNRLYLNRGDGTFEDGTEKAGVGAGASWSSSAVFFDADGDGHLDLYVCQYVVYRVGLSRTCEDRIEGKLVRSYCHPDVFPAAPDVLFRNRGDGTFEDITKEAGVYERENGKGLGVVASDVDGDGDCDLLVANDSKPNFFYRNLGDGTFRDDSDTSGFAYNELGEAEAGMGIDAGDVDGDGDFDLILVHYTMETNTLYLNEGDAIFRDGTGPARIGEPSLMYLGFGAGFADLDNDGDLDLHIANGHIMDNVGMFYSSQSFAQPDLLFENDGEGRFQNRSTEGGPAIQTPRVSRGTAFGDLDGDGDIDIVVQNSNAAPALLINQKAGIGRWIAFDLVGTKSNRDGIGARVTIEHGGRTQVEECRSGTSYLSHSALRVHFGVGSSTRVDRVRVRWPSGQEDLIESLEVDRMHRLIETEE